MGSLAWLGALGMFAIEASYVPQIVRLHRVKHADEVSIFFPSLNAAGRAAALLYALSSRSDVFVAGFIVGIALRLTLLGQVAWYRRRRPSSLAPAVAS